MLIIHDNGKILATMGGEYANPGVIVADIPAGKEVDRVNPETGEVILKDKEKTAGEQMEILQKAAAITAAGFTDEQAAKVPELYPAWRAGEAVTAGDRRSFGGKLYKAAQAHTTQADWAPDKTASLWTVIDVAHTGTAEDPIPASRSMEYTYGLCYLDPEDDGIYLCARAGEETGGRIVLHFLPHELIGQYFEVMV